MIVLNKQTSKAGYLDIYSKIIGALFNLTRTETKILSRFLFLNSNSQNTVLSKETSKVIRESLKISQNSFNNHKALLRKKQILLPNNTINPVITKQLVTKGEQELTFKFNIQ